MNEKNIMIARNELENRISEIQKALQLSEIEMMIAIEMALSTARYRTVVRGFYDEASPVEKGEDNGNTNEKGQ